MKKSVLRSYAKLIVRKGANVQKGQEVMIYADLDQPEFVQMVVEEAYRAKAKKVMVEWSYQPLAKVHTRYQTVKTLGDVPQWQIARRQHMVDTNPCRIHLISEDPDGLKGMNMEKVSKARQLSYPILKPYIDQLEGVQQWCIAAVPGVAWAKKVFPGCSKTQAVEKLWQAILSTSRVDDDPIAAWDQHNADLKARCDYLNGLGIEKLHYTADNGTDLTVEMIPQARFCGGGETSKPGVYFNPNIPTEEVFTSPMQGKAEGIVYSSKPLSYRGELIDNFFVRFENGVVVETGAEKNAHLLEKLVSMDEGARKLGECALVPFDSPINKTGILFYNTLFDENCCCHFALGRGFNNTLKNFENLSFAECKEKGINDSSIHVDFMIGTADLEIDGVTADGKVVPLFRKGNWAF